MHRRKLAKRGAQKPLFVRHTPVWADERKHAEKVYIQKEFPYRQRRLRDLGVLAPKYEFQWVPLAGITARSRRKEDWGLIRNALKAHGVHARKKTIKGYPYYALFDKNGKRLTHFEIEEVLEKIKDLKSPLNR
ncbi:MAG: hypothetical protein HY393_02830 [Candidatus Diapherotrites archaeon]|nr:hypothetical protein [Candidatus Diapherotrites archaeon]